MKTLQDLIDAELARERQAKEAAEQWNKGRFGREVAACVALRTYLRLYHDVELESGVLVEAFEQDCAPETQPRRYATRLVFPALDASISIAMHRDNAGNWHRSDEAYLAHVGSNSRTFTDLLAALLWITDNGQVALSGAPVLVTMPQMQEA